MSIIELVLLLLLASYFSRLELWHCLSSAWIVCIRFLHLCCLLPFMPKYGRISRGIWCECVSQILFITHIVYGNRVKGTSNDNRLPRLYSRTLQKWRLATIYPDSVFINTQMHTHHTVVQIQSIYSHKIEQVLYPIIKHTPLSMALHTHSIRTYLYTHGIERKERK